MGFHRSQILFYVLAGFLGGVFIASVLNVSEFFIYLGLIVAIGLICLFGRRKNFKKEAILVGLVTISFLFGAIRFNSANLERSQLTAFVDLKTSQKDVEVVLNGYIDSEPEIKGNKQDFILETKELVAGDKKISISDKTLVTTNAFPKFKYGDEISVRGALKSPKNFTDFDYVTYLKKEGVATIISYPDILDPRGLEIGLFEGLKAKIYREVFKVKRSFELSVSMSVSEPNASFVNGILLGSKQGMSDELKESFKKTGTTHILAISGYNIMIISWAILSVLTLFLKRRTAFWYSVAVIVLFVILTGASASVVRASMMGLLLLFAQGYGRLYDPKNSIILAGAAMVYFNPFLLSFDIGFQLSFAAILGLMYLYPYINSKFNRVPKLGNLKEIVLMTVSAQAAVAPLLIYYFRTFSFVSLLANVLIVPFLPASMLMGFVTGVGGIILPALGNVIGWTAWAVTAYQIWVIELLAQ